MVASESVIAACAVTCSGVTGRIRFKFQFYAAGGVQLGASEWRSAANELQSVRIAVPAGASHAALTAIFVGWMGTLEISELAVWRAS